MYLIINTISSKCLAAIVKNGRLFDKIVWESDYQHSEKLLAKIDQLLRTKKINLKKIAGVLVVNGPGSYTGIRVGVATGNALGRAFKIPVVGITYLDLLAHYAARQFLGDGKIVSVVKSIHDKFYFGIYCKPQGNLVRKGDYGNTQLGNIFSLVGRRSVCLVGDRETGIEKYANVIIVDSRSDAALTVLAEIAENVLEKADWHSLCLPEYINQPRVTV